MKPRYSSIHSYPAPLRFGVFTKAIILCFGGAVLAMSQSAQAAPNVTHSITATGDGTWTGATWSNGTPDGTTAGDLATPGTINSVTTLNSNVTIGSLLTTGSGRTWTINSNATNVLTLDGAGANTTTNGFGHADTASLRINTSGVGSFAINPDLNLATNTDIGTTSGDDEIVINGNITATAAVTLNFQNDSTTTGVAQSVIGSIGASGSNIAITNNSAGTAVASSVTLSGALGSAVTSINQNSTTSTFNLNGVTPTFAGSITLTAGTINVGTGGQLGASSNITGAGSLGVSGTGVLTLSGTSNTYSGGTTLGSGGTLNINSSTAIGATAGALTFSGSATINNTSAGAITLSNNNALTLSGGSPTFTGTKDLNLGTGTVTISGANRTITTTAGTLTLGGGITDAGGNRTLSKAGTGTLVLNGAAGTWTGGLTINNGAVVLGNPSAAGTGTVILSGANGIAPTLQANSDLSGANKLTNAFINTPGSSGSSSTISGTNNIEFGGDAILAGGSVATRNLIVNNSGSTIFSGNTYLNNSDAATTALIAGTGTLTINGNITNNNAGNTIASNLSKSGSGTLIISSNIAYTGTTTVTDGTLRLTGNNTNTGNTTVTGGTLILTGSNNNGGSATTTLNAGGTLQLQANVANTTSGASSALGTTDANFTFGSGTTNLQLRSNSAVTFNGIQALTIALGRTINIDVDTLTPATTGGALSFGSNGITATDLTLNVTGNTAGTGSSLAVGTIGGSSGAVRVTTINPTTANIAMAGYTVTGAAGSGLVLDGTSSGNTFGAIGGNANTALTKSNSSTWTLTGVNTYNGNTLVNAGTLILADNASLRFAIGATSGTNNSMTGAGTVTLNGDFVIDTSTASALTSGSWILENVSSLAGAYGSTFTVMEPNGTLWTDAGSNKWTKTDGTKTWTFVETTGTLTLADSGGSNYSTWAATYSPADVSNPAGDNDNDGLTNQQEYAYGLSPVAGSSVNPILEGLNKTASTFTYQRRKQSLTGLTYTILTSPDLVTWTPNTPSGQVVTPIASTDNESVAVTLSGTIPLSAAKFFVRVGAE